MKKILLIFLCLPMIGFGQIPGCTDSTACNYDPLATVDDGSCIYPTTSTTSITTCDSLVWPLNGQTYTSSGIYTNISSSGSPTLTGTQNTNGIAYGVFVSGNYAYVADGYSGLKIIDVSNPSSPTWTGTYNTTGHAYDVTVNGNYAFVADNSSGLHIIDVSNPSNPTLTGTYNTNGLAYGVTVIGNYALVASGSWGLQIINISNPSNPTLTTNYTFPGDAYDVTVRGIYAYVADGAFGLKIFNLSNLSSPTLTGTYNTTGDARGVTVNGNYAYVADEASGLQIIDISNPANPTLTATQNTNGIAYGVTVRGNYAYVADGYSGLKIINISNPSSPTWTGTYNTTGIAYGVTVRGNYAYVADGYSGLHIINVDLSCHIDSLILTFGVSGCIDSTATNYNPLATCDDGSCGWVVTCNSPVPTGLGVTELTHNRAKVNWADANTSNCMVEMYRVQYREQGTTTWSQKTALGSGLCIYGLTTTSKTLWNLSPSTTYEFRAKAWYCNTTGASSWSPIATFTTLDVCPNVDNFTVSTPTNTRATFSWTAPSSPYSFVRIKLRVDTSGAPWLTAGGYGVMYPALTRNKNGLTPGQNYLASSRTWCDPNGGPYKATSWTPFIYWTQPGTLIRIESEDSRINNLTIYPNPSRDIFNITFQAEEKQDLKVRLLNVIGEELMVEDLQQFIGLYTKGIDLSNNAKGIYFLEIETNYGVINKKLILQ